MTFAKGVGPADDWARVCEATGDGWTCPKRTKTPGNRFCGAHYAQRAYGVWQPVRGTVAVPPEPCVDCGVTRAIQGHGRCRTCYSAHRRLTAALDRTRPRCGCGNPLEAAGLCRRCLDIRDNHTDQTQVKARPGEFRPCEVEGCTARYRYNGMCARHAAKRAGEYQRHLPVLCARQNGVCALCFHPMPPAGDDLAPHPVRASVDHYMPRSMGGGHGIDNLRAVHQSCNAKRHAKLAVHYVPPPWVRNPELACWATGALVTDDPWGTPPPPLDLGVAA